MLFLIVLAVLIAVSAEVLRRVDYLSAWEPVAGIVGLISTISLLIAVVGIPFERMEQRAKIAEYHAIMQTAERGRAGPFTLEGAAYRMKIAEMNQWLAKAQYWRGTTFWIYWPAEVEALEPIQ